MSLHCPACGYKQICPCYKCQDVRDKKQEDLSLKPWQWTPGMGSKCGECGFEASSDFWSGLEKLIAMWTYTAITKPMNEGTPEDSLKILNILEQKLKEMEHDKKNKQT